MRVRAITSLDWMTVRKMRRREAHPSRAYTPSPVRTNHSAKRRRSAASAGASTSAANAPLPAPTVLPLSAPGAAPAEPL
eukprot:6188852-Pleurochrysis_carterae.AAC.2